MPAQRTTRTSTATTRKTSETIAEARKKLAEAHEQGRHRRTVPNCPTCEQAENGNGGNGKTAGSKTSTTKGNGTSRKPRGVTAPPFRNVTLLADLFLNIEGHGEKDFDLVTCPRCAALLPAGDRSEQAHKPSTSRSTASTSDEGPHLRGMRSPHLERSGRPSALRSLHASC